MIVWPATSSSTITANSRIALTIGGQSQTTLSGVSTMSTTSTTTWNRKQPSPGPRSRIERLALVLDRPNRGRLFRGRHGRGW